ncbi:MAG: 23S rRNA (guanosine(2251)-2'-O)-methyltransferase RlmB [Chitinophagales bacterium]|jgi:23S rRNA (guanosine2251-2'-O)-methyltransferase|nr:23S rRNA (guanosine(2251)-2'-O)-methyltransferase RlmB [Chitinophagales bacterium]
MRKKDIVFGRNPVLELLKSPSEIETIYVNKNTISSDLKQMFDLAAKRNIPVKKVPIDKIEYMLYPIFGKNKQSHQGIVAIKSSFEYVQIEDVFYHIQDSGKMPVFIFLDNVSDVGNFGAIIRSAVCFDIDAIVIPSRNSVSVVSSVYKTSAGAVEQMKIARVNDIISTFEFFVNNGFQILSLDIHHESKDIQDIDLERPTLLVMGSEGSGISRYLEDFVSQRIRVPMNFQAFDSLNVSVTAAIAMYELYKKKMIK